MRQKKNKLLEKKSVNKIALYNAIFTLFLVSILYFVLPKILNYPANTINNDFQLQVVGIKYNSQFIVLATLIVSFIFCFVKMVYHNIYKGSNSSTESISKTRKKCFNAPFAMIIIEILLPTILSGFLLALFKTNFSLLLRLCIVIFSFAAIFASMSYIIGRSFFRNLLIKTSSKCKNDLDSFRLNMSSKLVILILPLFLCSFVILLLVSFSSMTIQKGNLLYDFYKQELINSFENKNISYDDITSVFNTFKFKSDNDFGLIMDSSNGEILYKSKSKSVEDPNFLSAYTLQFYTDENGQCFEYYGQDTQVAMHKVKTNNNTYFVGVHFSTFSIAEFLPFIICIFILMIFIIIFIIYIGKTISNDVENITIGINSILHLADISTAKNLPITSNDEFGDLTISYNKLQDLTISHINQIQYNQDKLMEQERLASLGQLIGGIAHNLKTPIMSISGASKGLEDLIKEYDESIGDIEVTNEDHHEIATEMDEWIKKIKSYTEYMSDIITTVKGQVVTLSNTSIESFTIDELLKRVDILMKHELKNSLISLNVNSNLTHNISLHGNINSLIQVINNMISNSIQSYAGKPNQTINLNINQSGNTIIISITDYGCGMTKDVQDRLFNEMVTTKGKNGTGLGLFMSYSTIKANFNGNITFNSKEGEGTTFNIIIPLN